MPAKNRVSATRLKLIRTKTGLNQQDFAAKIGVAARTYAAYERGERKLPDAVRSKITEVFGITPYDLFAFPSNPEKLLDIGEATLTYDFEPEEKEKTPSVPERTKDEWIDAILSQLSESEVRELLTFAQFLKYKRDHSDFRAD